MPAQAKIPFEPPPIDYADRTLEVDIRWLHDYNPAPNPAASEANGKDDPTVVLDLTATQVHDLIENMK